MLGLDLMLLGDGHRFEQMCFRLARHEFPGAIALAQSWDGGRDVVTFDLSGAEGDVVLQCKFTEDLLGAKGKIRTSLDVLGKNDRRMARWILCVPVDPSGVFMNWLQDELATRGITGAVWGRSELLALLERHRDVLESFFYGVYAELRSLFRTEHLELFRWALDPECQWRQPDAAVLSFFPRGNVTSPDLVFDVIVRNTATVGTALTGIEAEVFDWQPKLHGLPGSGLLFPQITYAVSIGGGKAGVHSAPCEPPLLVGAGEPERFKIRVSDTGYAWNGALRLSLLAGLHERLQLPAMRLWT